MTRNKPSNLPKYRRQKSRPYDRAFVELNGQRIYLGRWDAAESKEQYGRLMADWLANGRQLSVAPDEILINELLARFIQHAELYYRRRDGSPTQEISDMKMSLRPVRKLFGSKRVSEFGPRALKIVRQRMIDGGLARGVINRRINRIRHVFKWGVSEELVPATVHQALQALPGLKRGRTEARETDPIKPVPEAHVNAIEPHVSRQVWAMVQLQLHTGARSGEIVPMRPIDLDMSGKVWLYRPVDHKTAYQGRERTIYIGPRGQEFIRPFLQGRPVDMPLFSPAEAVADKRETRRLQRKTPLSFGNSVGTNAKTNPKRVPADAYTRDSYRRAIQRGCELSNVPKWHPHQLRHSCATNLRKEFGLEAAQLLLGHTRCDVTQLYAELNHEKALQVAAKIG